jgi:hypothetical protein
MSRKLQSYFHVNTRNKDSCDLFILKGQIILDISMKILAHALNVDMWSRESTIHKESHRVNSNTTTHLPQ